jgi:hypothetical protein
MFRCRRLLTRALIRASMALSPQQGPGSVTAEDVFDGMIIAKWHRWCWLRPRHPETQSRCNCPMDELRKRCPHRPVLTSHLHCQRYVICICQSPAIDSMSLSFLTGRGRPAHFLCATKIFSGLTGSIFALWSSHRRALPLNLYLVVLQEDGLFGRQYMASEHGPDSALDADMQVKQ